MTSTDTSSSVRATTATKPSVRRAWNPRGSSRPSRGRRVRSLMPLSALGEGVPGTPDGEHEGRRRGVVLDLVAQVAHVNVDGLLVLVERLVVTQQLQEL